MKKIAWFIGLIMLALGGCAQGGARAELRLALAGDLAFGAWQRGQYFEANMAPFFTQVKPWLEGVDWAAVNLEQGICDAESRAGGDRRRPLWLSSPEQLAGVKALGFDLVNLANNHSLDCGPDGLPATQRALTQRGLNYVGTKERPWVSVELELGEIVVIGVTDRGLPGKGDHRPNYFLPQDLGLSTLELIEQVRAAKPDALVIVSVHWGREGIASASPRQRTLGTQWLAAGADIIWGHHGHLLKEAELTEQGLILYDMGDFAMGRPERSTQGIALVDLSRREGRWEVLDFRLQTYSRAVREQ